METTLETQGKRRDEGLAKGYGVAGGLTRLVLPQTGRTRASWKILFYGLLNILLLLLFCLSFFVFGNEQ